MAERQVTLDLGIADVHSTSAGVPWKPVETDLSISAAKRKGLPTGEFALPSQRKYPIDTADRTRNAAARLEQMKKRGMVSPAEYSEARKRIGRAAKKFGIASEYNATDHEPEPAAVSKPDRRKRVPKTIHVRADLAPGGALHVRHMSNRAFYDGEGVLLSDSLEAEKVDGPVWVQIAKQGAFAGHPAGPFKLDTKTFEEIVANFKATSNRHIAWDFEHASEQDATSGSIPQAGAPAQGWITDLKIEGGNLYGLTEWGDLARQYVQEKKYRYCSPAIRFGSKDRVTGKPIGARLTSVALTNEPFLDGMEPLAAKDGGERTVTMTSAQGDVLVWDGAAQAWKTRGRGNGGDGGAAPAAVVFVPMKGVRGMLHSPHEYMPQLKAALKLGPLSTHAECSDALARVRELCMKVGPEGMHDGVPMGDYCRPLMSMVGAAPGMTVEDLFDTVEDLIAHAIDQHVAEMHPGGAQMDDDPGDGGGDMHMSDKTQELSGKLTEAEGKVTTLNDKLATAAGRIAELEKGAVIVVTLKDGEKGREAFARTFEVQLKDGESPTDFVKRVVAENATLLKAKADRDEADLQADVDMAFETYKDQKKLTPEQKPAMLAHARAARASFMETYPPVAPSERHLLAKLVPEEKKPAVEKPVEVPGYNETVRKLMAEKGLSLTDAQVEASSIVRNATKRARAQKEEAEKASKK